MLILRAPGHGEDEKRSGGSVFLSLSTSFFHFGAFFPNVMILVLLMKLEKQQQHKLSQCRIQPQAGLMSAGVGEKQ